METVDQVGDNGLKIKNYVLITRLQGISQRMNVSKRNIVINEYDVNRLITWRDTCQKLIFQ